MDYIVELILASLLLILMLLDFINSKFDYWFRLQIPGPEPNIFCGNIGDVVLGRRSLVEKVEELYSEWNSEPYFGIFVWHTPVLMINDLNVIRNILVDNSKLFSSPKFVINRGIIHRSSYKSGSIDHPKVLERILTSDRMKNMFDLIIKCTNESSLHKMIEENRIMNCSSLAENFTSEVMSSCVFGIEEKASLGERQRCRDIIRGICRSDECNSYEEKFRIIIGTVCSYLGVKKNPKKWDFFVKVIREKIRDREERNIVRPDFLDALRDLKGGIRQDDFEWTDSLLTAQTSFLLISSYSPSVSLISTVLHELAINQQVQERLRTEIIETLKLYNELSADIVKGMEYISMVLNETLRKHPMNALLKRKLNEKCQVEGSKINVPKNIRVVIPVASIHNNEEYYPDPDTFSPERFCEEKMNGRHSMTFLPYEGGPKSSIGEKFAIYSAKLVLIFLLKKFRINPVENKSYNVANTRKFRVKFVSLE
ncbi:cytochrome P450 6B5 [Diachasma alloeum]|uniref:cytochrome P450 6B5 n=1 Tax=Diachasma alloeum TaxID=454923 RepID=UPI0007384666|nr:cytochrome P450 6B5 [Diachasma alloeum]